MWDLPGPGLEPVSPALAGGFLTTEPPGKPQRLLFSSLIIGERFVLFSCHPGLRFSSPFGSGTSRPRVLLTRKLPPKSLPSVMFVDLLVYTQYSYLWRFVKTEGISVTIFPFEEKVFKKGSAYFGLIHSWTNYYRRRSWMNMRDGMESGRWGPWP